MPKRGKERLFAGCDLMRHQRMVFGYYGEKGGGIRVPLVLSKDCGTDLFLRSVVVPELAQRGISPNQVTVFPDPSGDFFNGQTEATDAEILRSYGFDVSIPILKNNDPYTRIQTVKEALVRTTADGEPYIQIDPGAEELIRAMLGGYTYGTTRAAGGQIRTGDKPDKKNPYSHIADAFQYLLVGLKYGGREIRAFGGITSASFADRFAAASDGRDRGLFC